MLIKQRLKKLPRLYASLQRTYYTGLYLSERYVLGTRLHELWWKIRQVDEMVGRSLRHPHRAFLVERIGRFAPFESLLEVGCNAGPNLVVLGRTYPDARLYGIDISAQAIKVAEKVLVQDAIGNASVSMGRADDLHRFADKSIDVALTDATLMYVGPDKIARALSELVRVARKVLIFNEWCLFEGDCPGVRAYWYDAHWVHDYQALLSDMPGVRTVRVERLPHGLWGPGGWEEYGALVEVELG